MGSSDALGWAQMRHLNTNCLWVQEKGASRELQYHKVKGSDNSACLFTKALDHDSIRKDTESMGSEFVFGKGEPLALTVNNLGATLSMKKLAMETERQFGTKGRMDAWTRMDLQSKSYKTTHKGGPTWKDVAYRVTADARSEDIINIEDVANSPPPSTQTPGWYHSRLALVMRCVVGARFIHSLFLSLGHLLED